MRDYTYLNGARFTINNLFRSLRFDIDRLDMSWVDGEKPEFCRGLRVVDNDAGNTVTVDGEDADITTFVETHIELSSALSPPSLNFSSTSSKKLCLAKSTFFASITCESLII